MFYVHIIAYKGIKVPSNHPHHLSKLINRWTCTNWRWKCPLCTQFQPRNISHMLVVLRLCGRVWILPWLEWMNNGNEIKRWKEKVESDNFTKSRGTILYTVIVVSCHCRSHCDSSSEHRKDFFQPQALLNMGACIQFNSLPTRQWDNLVNTEGHQTSYSYFDERSYDTADGFSEGS